MKKFAILAFVFLFLASAEHASWQQQMKVVATDTNGGPVDGASVALAYQMSDPASDSDGNVTGFTDAKGEFFANISNSVEGGEERRTIEVNISAFYWDGASKTVLADSPGINEVSFQLPVALEPLRVVALDSESKPLQGAAVALENEPVKITQADGAATFMVPPGLPLTGSAAYGNYTETYSSGQMAIVNGVKTIEVSFAFAQNPPEAAPGGADGTQTNLLEINSMEAAKDGNNCYVVTANITDPRKELPLEIRFRVLDNNAILPAGVDQNGLFFTRTCVVSKTVVQVTAFNKLENATANVTLEYAPPPPPTKWNGTVPSGWGEKKPETTPPWALAIVAALVFVALIGGAAYYITRKKTGEKKSAATVSQQAGERRIFEMVSLSENKVFEMAVRPVIIYVRKMFFLFTRKKRKPPKTVPPLMAS